MAIRKPLRYRPHLTTGAWDRLTSASCVHLDAWLYWSTSYARHALRIVTQRAGRVHLATLDYAAHDGARWHWSMIPELPADAVAITWGHYSVMPADRATLSQSVLAIMAPLHRDYPARSIALHYVPDTSFDPWPIGFRNEYIHARSTPDWNAIK